MADPRDVEAAREWMHDWIRVGEQMPGGADRDALIELLTVAREQERQACEEIVREVRNLYGAFTACDEILRRIRERSEVTE